MANYVGAISQDVVLVAQVGHELGRGTVHRFGKPARIADEALVFEADARLVLGPVARVPGDVLFPDRMSNRVVGGADGVVGRDLRFGVPKPVYGACPGAPRDVDHDLVYRVGSRALVTE